MKKKVVATVIFISCVLFLCAIIVGLVFLYAQSQ